jgi:hypothetical protein
MRGKRLLLAMLSLVLPALISAGASLKVGRPTTVTEPGA